MFVRDLRILASSVVNTGQPDNAGLSPALPAWPDGRAGQSTRDSRKGSTAAALAAAPGLRGPLFPTSHHAHAPTTTPRPDLLHLPAVRSAHRFRTHAILELPTPSLTSLQLHQTLDRTHKHRNSLDVVNKPSKLCFWPVHPNPGGKHS